MSLDNEYYLSSAPENNPSQHHHHHHHQRRCSEGYLNANDMLTNCEDVEDRRLSTRRGTNPSMFEGHFLEILRKNCEIMSAFADVDDQAKERASRSKNSMVRGPVLSTRTASPRPLIIQQQSKWRNDESTSISSADSAIEELIDPKIQPKTTPQSGNSGYSTNATWDWIRKEAKSFVDDVVDAFEAGAPVEKSTTLENDKLSAMQLRKDLKRFHTAVHPYLEVLSALYDLIMWKNPLSTLLLVLVIVYSLYRGWTMCLFFLLLLCQLSINYLSYVKNIDIGWMFLPRKPVALPKFDISGAQLIFDIAKLAQKLLRVATNILEKIESLLTWKNLKVSRVFTALVVYWLTWTVLFSFGTCAGYTVLAVGVRIFLTTYLFARFPGLRKRFDTYGYFYRNLPLRSPNAHHRRMVSRIRQDSDYVGERERCSTPFSASRKATISGEKFSSRLGSNFNLDQSAAVNLLLGPNHKPAPPVVHPHQQTPTPTPSETPVNDDQISLATEANSLNGSMTTVDTAAAVAVAKPETSSIGNTSVDVVCNIEPCTSRSRAPTTLSSSMEDEEDDYEHMEIYADPIIDNVIAFRSCVLNERERMFPMGITSGILYLTDAALVFRSRHTNDNKDQLMLLFHDVRHVKKTQSLRSMSLITGTRKSLEIYVEGRRKPVQFIGIAKRDDFVTRIQLMCRNAGAVVEFSEQ